MDGIILINKEKGLTSRDVVNQVSKKLKIKKGIFNIIFVTNEEIHKINKEYRKVDRVTDVISFALEDNKDIEYKDKFSKANRVVKQALEQLNPDNSTNKTFNIPDDLINKENIESIIRNINKFLK